MIKNIKPLNMTEVVEYIKKTEDSETDVIGFIKKFKKLNLKKSEELKKNIEELDLMKINEKHIIKILDLMPENAEELNKIFTDVSLNEDETNKILETINKVK